MSLVRAEIPTEVTHHGLGRVGVAVACVGPAGRLQTDQLHGVTWVQRTLGALSGRLAQRNAFMAGESL